MAKRDPGKTSLSVRIDTALVERARTIARDLAGKPHYLTIAQLVEESLTEAVRRYEALDDDSAPGRMRPSRNTIPHR